MGRGVEVGEGQHYTDLPDIKRVLANTHFIDPQVRERVGRVWEDQVWRGVGRGVKAVCAMGEPT